MIVSTDRRKAVALLAYLAVTAQPHTRDSLATLLWPGYDTASSYAYLRRTLWEINQMLGPGWLETERDQVWLKQDNGLWVDAAAFLTHLTLFRQTPTAPEPLTAAIALYRDHFLAGFSLRDSEPFDTWQQLQTEHFRRELAWTLEQLAAAYAEQAAWDTALSYVQRWLALDPLQEAAHRAIMRLYAVKGDRATAIRQYETCAQLLKQELDLTPSAATTAQWDEIRSGYPTQR
jgi:DNA-binding SARP family transcriptional activator